MSTFRFRWPGFLVLSIALHVVVIFLWNWSLPEAVQPSHVPITVTLQATIEPSSKAMPVDAVPVPETAVLPEPAPGKPELVVTEEPNSAAASPLPTASAPASAPAPAPSAQKPIVAGILSRQFNLETPGENPFSVQASVDTEIPELGLAELPLANSLRVPTPIQLPFVDTRIYLVDSYHAGIGGSVERFFDSVTVPFGWTTEGGLRVQCAWMMIIAGCTWGDKELFYRKAERRKEIME